MTRSIAIAVAAACVAVPHLADACTECGRTLPANYHEYIHSGTELLGDDVSLSSTATNVWLDFSAVTFRYSLAERQAVVAQMQQIYAGFNINFSLTAPPVAAERIVFDNDPLGGVASEIDFRNQSTSVAFVGTNDSSFLFNSSREVTYAARVGAHELGHLLGLRHHDSQGPIGSGVYSDGTWNTLPSYPGPRNADTEGFFRTMSTPAVGGSFENFTNAALPFSFSERSLAKLSFNEQGVLVPEAPGSKSSIATAQAVTLQPLSVPNNLPAGSTNAGLLLDVESTAVAGRIASPGQVDFYAIEASAGEFLNIEVISQSIDRFGTDTIDTFVSVFDSGGSLLNYYGSAAQNDDEFESGFFGPFDSILVDLIIPTDGTYYISVQSSPQFAASDTGSYELYAYTFSAVIPEPASLAVAGVGLLALRRRR